jgi:plastocyanin
MQISSTIYTTRIVENTITRVETVTFVTTIPYVTTFVTTLTGTTTMLRVVTATKTPTVYLNQTVRLTTTIEVQQEAIIPWTYLILPLMLLLPFPPLLIMKGRRLTITILEGAGAQTSVTQQTSILNEYLKPAVGSIKRGGKVIFRNKDRVIHTVELFIPGVPDKHWVFVLKPGEKAGIKMKEPGKYFIILERVPRKVGILEVG